MSLLNYDNLRVKRSRKPGYILLEMMLALSIFVVAVGPLGRVINDSLNAYLTLQEERDLQTALLNQTELAMASRLELGEKTFFSEDARMKTVIRVQEHEEDYDLEKTVTNMYRVEITVELDGQKQTGDFFIRGLQ